MNATIVRCVWITKICIKHWTHDLFVNRLTILYISVYNNKLANPSNGIYCYYFLNDSNSFWINLAVTIEIVGFFVGDSDTFEWNICILLHNWPWFRLTLSISPILVAYYITRTKDVALQSAKGRNRLKQEWYTRLRTETFPYEHSSANSLSYKDNWKKKCNRKYRKWANW